MSKFAELKRNASVKDVMERHGYRLITSDETGKEFTLHALAPSSKLSDNVF